MREILFRGKRTDNGEWIEGFYYQRQNPLTINGLPIYHGIADFAPFGAEVIPETVGQYTGLSDRNGIKIFEGDIVSFERVNALGYITARIGEVKYYDKLPIFYIFATTGDAWDWCDCENIKVIGNIHDNPDLLTQE